MKHFIFLLSVCFLLSFNAAAQVADTGKARVDSVAVITPPPISPLNKILAENIFINTKAAPVSLAVKTRNPVDKDPFFYLLLSVVAIFAIARAAYSKYFSNLFRVFFNSSLRQNQLTDQLVQDQLPSLVFNSLFVISAGLYFYFLMLHYHLTTTVVDPKLIFYCIIGVAIIYVVKYLILKFTGWITGFRQEADIYTFIIFLINKIIGICLLPVIVVLAFSDNYIANIFVIFSFALVGLLILMRFFRSYGLLQPKIKVSRFHFLLYIFSVELLPLFIIYKAVLLFFDRRL